MVPDLHSHAAGMPSAPLPAPAHLAGIGVVISGGGLLDPCVEVYTDIYDAYYGFPGYLKTG